MMNHDGLNQCADIKPVCFSMTTWTMVTTLAMVFILAERAQLRWQRLLGHKLIVKVFEGVKFIKGI